MKCLVLGGGGFIGSHLAQALAQAGHRVRVFDRPRGRFLPLLERCEVVTGDFLRAEDVARALEDIEVIFHLVCTTVPKSSNEDQAADVEANVAGTLRLLDLCRSRGARRLVFASSGGTVYGVPRALPIDEAQPTQPISSYGIHKLMVEKYLHLNQVLHGLDYRVLRIANVYGERQRIETAQGAVAVFLDRIRRGEALQIWGDGSVVRDYVYVGDVVQAFLKVLGHGGGERVFNIGSGAGVSLSRLVDEIARVVGSRPAVDYTPARRFDVPANVLDASLARRALGWQAATPLGEGLRRAWEWVRQSGL